jgi:hypothetical protein
MKLYQVVGRKAPTKTDENPPAYRMKLFARNEVNAKSRFWYFMHQMRKMKKTTGEILDVNEVSNLLPLLRVNEAILTTSSLIIAHRLSRRTPTTLRTTVSGLSTTPEAALTICTASTVTSALTTLLRPYVSFPPVFLYAELCVASRGEADTVLVVLEHRQSYLPTVC